MATVLLGNEAPIEPKTGVVVNGEKSDKAERGSLPDRTIVVIDTPDFDLEGNPVPLSKKLTEIRNAFAVHSEQEPAWVEGLDEEFNNLLVQEFNTQLGRPEHWDAPQTSQETTSDPESSEPAHDHTEES